MAIDLQKDTLLSFADAARLLPATERGTKLHTATIWRWATKGRVIGGRRIKLENLVVGGRRVTSTEALNRFAMQVTEAVDAEMAAREAEPTTSSSEQEQRIAQAREVLPG